MRSDVLTTLTAPSQRIRLTHAGAERAFAALVARYKWVALPLAIAFCARAGLFVIATIAARILTAGPFPGALEIWNRWDAVWYTGIAQNGYYYSPVDQSSANFFPLLPALSWLARPAVAAAGRLRPLRGGGDAARLGGLPRRRGRALPPDARPLRRRRTAYWRGAARLDLSLRLFLRRALHRVALSALRRAHVPRDGAAPMVARGASPRRSPLLRARLG